MSCRGTHLIAFNRYLRTGRSGCSKSVIFTTRQVCSLGNSAPGGLAAHLFRSSHLVESFGAAGTCWLIGNGVGLTNNAKHIGHTRRIPSPSNPSHCFRFDHSGGVDIWFPPHLHCREMWRESNVYPSIHSGCVFRVIWYADAFGSLFKLSYFRFMEVSVQRWPCGSRRSYGRTISASSLPPLHQR